MNLHWHPIPNEGGGIYGEEHHGESAWVDGERSAVASEDSGGFIMQWATRWGMNAEDALEAIAEVQERALMECGSEGHAAAVKAQRFYRALMLAVKAYRGPRAFALDCACLALGWKDILGCQTQIELAKKWKCTKANVEKCVGNIQKQCGIPETVEQRDEAARRKMSWRRKGQLKGRPQIAQIARINAETQRTRRNNEEGGDE